jgi:hypothetical protein
MEQLKAELEAIDEKRKALQAGIAGKAEAKRLETIGAVIDNEREIAKLQEDAGMKLISIEGQIAALEEKRANMQATIALSGDADKSRALEVEEITQRINDLIHKRTEQLSQAAKKADEDRVRAYEQEIDERDRARKDYEDEQKRHQQRARNIAENAKSEKDAAMAVSNAKQSRDESMRDRRSLTLEEAASSKQTSVRSRAKEILRLEAQAKRQTEQGFAKSAEESMSRANVIRNRASFLRAADRDPDMAAQRAVVDSEKHLKEIRDSLKPGNSDD